MRRAGLARYCWWWWWQCWWWRRPPTHSHSDTGKSMAMDFWQAAHPPPLPSPAATPIFNRQHSLQLSPLWWPLFTKHTLHHPVHPPPWNQLQTTLMASCRLEASVCQSGKSTLATTIVTTVASWTSLEKSFYLLLMSVSSLREALTKKKMFSFGHCPKRGGGDPCPNFLTLFFHHVVPYILTSISCYVILFGHF